METTLDTTRNPAADTERAQPTVTRLASDLDPQVRQADAPGAERLEALLAREEQAAAQRRAQEEERQRRAREEERQTMLTHLGARQAAFAALLREGIGEALYGALAREADLRFEGFDMRGFVGNRHYMLPRARFTLRDAQGAAHEYTLLPLNAASTADALIIALLREDDGVAIVEGCRLDPEMREALGPALAAQRRRLLYGAERETTPGGEGGAQAETAVSAEERARRRAAALTQAQADAQQARYALERAALAAARERRRLFQATERAGARLITGGAEHGAARLVEIAVATRATREYASPTAQEIASVIAVEDRLEAAVASDGAVRLLATHHLHAPDKRGRSATSQRITLSVGDMQRLMAVWLEWRSERMEEYLDATREAAAEAQREIGIAYLLATEDAGAGARDGTLDERLERLETVDDPTADLARQSVVALAWGATERAGQIVDALPDDVERQERAAWEMLERDAAGGSAATGDAIGDATPSA